ncbi:MAG: DUF4430 domain-containing protein [Lachnospiraceae bacterium]|nr:DUF4430 domain-containing protein [Lachnospiraceae bacterium]
MQENKNRSKKELWFGALFAVVLVAVLVAVYLAFGAKPVAGSKEITIEVVDKEAGTTTYELLTDAAYLRQAMEEAEGLTFSGSESEYGLMVDTVNGERADYHMDGAYWCFYVNGEYSNYGIDTQPVMDGDRYTIRYEKAQ